MPSLAGPGNELNPPWAKLKNILSQFWAKIINLKNQDNFKTPSGTPSILPIYNKTNNALLMNYKMYNNCIPCQVTKQIKKLNVHYVYKFL